MSTHSSRHYARDPGGPRGVLSPIVGKARGLSRRKTRLGDRTGARARPGCVGTIRGARRAGLRSSCIGGPAGPCPTRRRWGAQTRPTVRPAPSVRPCLAVPRGMNDGTTSQAESDLRRPGSSERSSPGYDVPRARHEPRQRIAHHRSPPGLEVPRVVPVAGRSAPSAFNYGGIATLHGAGSVARSLLEKFKLLAPAVDDLPRAGAPPRRVVRYTAGLDPRERLPDRSRVTIEGALQQR